MAIAALRPKIGNGKPIRTNGIKFRVSNINFDPLVNVLATDMREMRLANRSMIGLISGALQNP